MKSRIIIVSVGIFVAFLLMYVGGWKIMYGWELKLSILDVFSSGLSSLLEKKSILFAYGDYAGQYAILFNDKYYGFASTTRFFNSPYISGFCFWGAIWTFFYSLYEGIFGE